MAQSFGGIFADGWAHRVSGAGTNEIATGSLGSSRSASRGKSAAVLKKATARLEAAHTRVAWGAILRERGEGSAAHEQLKKRQRNSLHQD